MKMLRKIKLRALLFRRHYSRYHRLNGGHSEHGGGGGSNNLFRGLCKFTTPIAYCVKAYRKQQKRDTHATQHTPRDVHRGYCTVYVGPEQKRYVLKTCYLEHPVFGVLLQRSEEEFGFDYNGGGLTIPCTVSVFEYVLRLMKKNDPFIQSGEVTRLIHTSCDQVHEQFY